MENPRSFLEHWFAGFEKGLEKLDDTARRRLLSECGRACADSHTRAIFREAASAGDGLAGFLERLGRSIPDAAYRIVEENVVEVIYTRCGCDLVANGWVSSSALCACSVHTLEENFRTALERPVRVRMTASILGGASRCRFLVTLKSNS